MAVIINGVSRRPIVNGAMRTAEIVNGVNRLDDLSAAVEFTASSSMAGFAVGADGIVVWTPPTVGTLVGTPTYTNGQSLGRVVTPVSRVQLFMVTVPNDPTLWTNAGDTITINLADLQEQGIFVPTLVITLDTPSATSFTLQATVNEQFGNVTSGRFEYKKSSDSTWDTVPGLVAGGGTALNGTINGLDPNTSYDLRAFATNEAGEGASPIVMNTTSLSAFQPADIVTGISVSLLGSTTVTTNSSGFVYYIGDLSSGGQTFTADTNIQTQVGTYPLTDRLTPRTPNIGIEVDDTSAPNNGAQLSIRTLQTVTQAPALPNVTTLVGSGNAGSNSEHMEGSINSIGATADMAFFYWLIDDTPRSANYLVANGNSIVASGTAGSVQATAIYGSATVNRTLQYVLRASNSNGSTNGAVVSQAITPISIQGNTVITLPPDNIANTTATLRGDVTVGIGNEAFDLAFIYGTDRTEVEKGVISSTGNPIGSGVLRITEAKKDLPAETPVNLLVPNTTYFYAFTVRGATGWEADLTAETFMTTNTTYSGNITYIVPTHTEQSTINPLLPMSYSGVLEGHEIHWTGTLVADIGFEFADGSNTMAVVGQVMPPSGGGDITVDLRHLYPVMGGVDFDVDDLELVIINNIPAEGLSAGDSISNLFSYNFASSVSSITTFLAVPPNNDTADTNVQLIYIVSGTTPLGFADAGTLYTLTGSITVPQNGGIVPFIETLAPTNIFGISATLRGSVTGMGTAPVTDTWFLYSDSEAVVNSGGGTRLDVTPIDNTGVFQEDVTGLSTGTTYYYRAYGENAVDVSGGATQEFDVPEVITIPTVTTDSLIASGSIYSAIGTVTDDGNGEITAAGIEYTSTASFADSTSQVGFYIAPTIRAFAFLPAGTYMYRMYATNSAGTGVGATEIITIT